MTITLTKPAVEEKQFLDSCRRVLAAGLPAADLIAILEAIGSEDKEAALRQILAERQHPLTQRSAQQALDLIGGQQ